MPLLEEAPARLQALVASHSTLPALTRWLVELVEKRAAGRMEEPKASGMLRASEASVWQMGSYVKPKTTPPSLDGQSAHGMSAAKPPSNRPFHEDLMRSMVDPARGTRLGTFSQR